MQNLPSFLFGCYFFTAAGIAIFPIILVWAVTAPFDPTGQVLHRFTSWFTHTFYFRLNPGWRCRFEGLEHLNASPNFVVVANHQSYWDIMILQGLPVSFKWVSKRLIGFIPFVGLTMVLNQYILFDRGNIRSIKNMMQACRRWLSVGTSVVIFPEGTRSSDGQIGTFHTGAFKLAGDCNVPVLPVVLDGGGTILPKGNWNMTFNANVTLRILPPVLPSDFNYDVNALSAQVRELMVQELKAIRAAEQRAKQGSATTFDPAPVLAFPPR